MINTGFWYDKADSYLLENQKIESYYGQKEDEIEDFELIYSGRIKKPDMTDSKTIFTILDDRILTSKTILHYYQSLKH